MTSKPEVRCAGFVKGWMLRIRSYWGNTVRQNILKSHNTTGNWNVLQHLTLRVGKIRSTAWKEEAFHCRSRVNGEKSNRSVNLQMWSSDCSPVCSQPDAGHCSPCLRIAFTRWLHCSGGRHKHTPRQLLQARTAGRRDRTDCRFVFGLLSSLMISRVKFRAGRPAALVPVVVTTPICYGCLYEHTCLLPGNTANCKVARL